MYLSALTVTSLSELTFQQDLVRRVTELTRKRHPHLEQLLGTCFIEDHLYVVRLSSKLVPVREYAQENTTFRRDEIVRGSPARPQQGADFISCSL